MGFFAPIYHEPPHHKAIMGVDVFRSRKQLNQNPYAQNEIDSFYMNLVVSSWWYWAFPDIQNLMVAPEVPLRRGVATGDIKEAFIEIYDEYAIRTRGASHIQYEI